MQTTTTTMENIPNRRRKTSSGEAFSFPIYSSDDQNNDFEFGSCLTPDSPASSTAAADLLFFNGRLLPHSFPFRPPETAASRTSSLLSSRSTSTNSSTSSSARTSSSVDGAAAAERRSLLYRQCKAEVSAQVYGSSLRWQFMPGASAVVVVPTGLSRDTSRRRSPNKKKVKKNNKKKKVVARAKRPSWRIGRRIFRWFVSACKECHAIQPRPRK